MEYFRLSHKQGFPFRFLGKLSSFYANIIYVIYLNNNYTSSPIAQTVDQCHIRNVLKLINEIYNNFKKNYFNFAKD